MAQFMGPDTLMGRALSLGGALGQSAGEEMIFNTAAMHAAEIPAANGITNAASLSRMYAACVSDVDGIRLLTPETVAKVSETQTSGPDQVLMLESTFGLGFMTVGDHDADARLVVVRPRGCRRLSSASATPTAVSRSAT